MNKSTIGEKDKNVNDLRRELDALKMLLTSKERELEVKSYEQRQQMEQLTQKNDYIQKETTQVKQELRQKVQKMSEELSQLRPLAAIANTLVNYTEMVKEDEDNTLDAVKERVKELIMKESQYEIQMADNETQDFKVTELTKVMELQKNQIDKLQEVLERQLRFINPDISRQDMTTLVSIGSSGTPTDKFKGDLGKKIQEDIEKNLVVEKRFEYAGQRWCILTNQNAEKSQKRYIIQKEEDVLASPLKPKINA